jgi:hypothetical protein
MLLSETGCHETGCSEAILYTVASILPRFLHLCPMRVKFGTCDAHENVRTYRRTVSFEKICAVHALP